MGIVNVTPDSFSDGGRFAAREQAVAHAVQLAAEGADWIDVGGESTRPGAAPVPAEVERERVVGVIADVVARLPEVTVSVDTSKAGVAAAALAAGAHVVNDVTALGDPDMAAVCADHGAGVVLMHMRGTPATMQRRTRYDDLVEEVCGFLAERADYAIEAGIEAGHLHLDPGLGFGKAPLDNPALIAATPRLVALGFPVLIGASRKRFIGDLTGVTEAAQRVAGSVGAAIAAVACGASVVRVHDVAATCQALAVYRAVMEARTS